MCSRPDVKKKTKSQTELIGWAAALGGMAVETSTSEEIKKDFASELSDSP